MQRGSRLAIYLYFFVRGSFIAKSLPNRASPSSGHAFQCLKLPAVGSTCLCWPRVGYDWWSTLIPGYKCLLASNSWASADILIQTKRISHLYDKPNTNLWEMRQKRNVPHHGNTGTGKEYSDREDYAIWIDDIWYGWIYTQISNKTRGLAKISRSGWIITSKVLITNKISHMNLHRRHILYIERYYFLGFLQIDSLHAQLCTLSRQGETGQWIMIYIML